MAPDCDSRPAYTKRFNCSMTIEMENQMDDDRAAARLSALGHPTRLRIFRTLISAGPEGMPAGELARRVDVAKNNLSSHLNVLRQGGLVDMRPSGRSRIYAVDLDAISQIVGYLVSDCCQGHPEVCDALAPALGGTC